ncbi:unnamed protein product [Meganyctiphanes norvegica]|uniref:Ubiquitin-like domain-containing protein n=1 Tax=Meganyctiphanes norvegica TaxID=48144 RepID=A0AAV2SKJ4_MEGNR
MSATMFSNSNEHEFMNVIIRLTGSWLSIHLVISNDTTVAELKTEIMDNIGVHPSHQTLFIHGKVMVNLHLLYNYGVQDGSVITLVTYDQPKLSRYY